jgi:hypothetical protein
VRKHKENISPCELVRNFLKETTKTMNGSSEPLWHSRGRRFPELAGQHEVVKDIGGLALLSKDEVAAEDG